jgi:hypothetical protein
MDDRDLRSLGQKSTHPNTVASRERARLLENAGLCKYCGNNAVQNRKTCYECSLKQSQYTYLAGLRKHLKEVGVDLETCEMPSDPKTILAALIERARYR